VRLVEEYASRLPVVGRLASLAAGEPIQLTNSN